MVHGLVVNDYQPSGMDDGIVNQPDPITYSFFLLPRGNKSFTMLFKTLLLYPFYKFVEPFLPEASLRVRGVPYIIVLRHYSG